MIPARQSSDCQTGEVLRGFMGKQRKPGIRVSFLQVIRISRGRVEDTTV